MCARCRLPASHLIHASALPSWPLEQASLAGYIRKVCISISVCSQVQCMNRVVFNKYIIVVVLSVDGRASIYWRNAVEFMRNRGRSEWSPGSGYTITRPNTNILDRIERTASDAWVCGVPIQPFWPPYRCGARSGGGGAHATAAQAPAGRNGSMGHRCPCVSPACECDVALARMSPEATGFLIETLRLSTVPGTSSRLRLR